MPDPNTHADDMKLPADYTPRFYEPPTIKDSLPPMWWFCPWPVVTALAQTVDHLKSTSRGEQASRIAVERVAGEAMQERNRAEKQLEVAKAGLDAMGKRLDAARAERDIALGEQFAALKERDEQKKRADDNLKANNRLFAELSKTEAERDNYRKELAEADQQLYYARNDRDDNARKLAEHAKANEDLKDRLSQTIFDLDRERAIHENCFSQIQRLKRQVRLAKAKSSELVAAAIWPSDKIPKAKAKPAKAKKKGGAK
jgi:chromosome segregation ATPase